METVHTSANKKVKYLTIGAAIVSFGLLIFTWHYGDPNNVDNYALNASSRMANGLLTGVLMAMTLSLTLTANLYSPRLAKIFVRHPLVVVGISLILFNHLAYILSSLITVGHRWHNEMLLFNYTLGAATLVFILPFLYYLSRFIRPKFFLPIIEKHTTSGLEILYNEAGNSDLRRSIFQNIDTLNNIGIMASRRDDKQLVKMIFIKNHNIIKNMMNSYKDGKEVWRQHDAVFLTGISKEGRDYLLKKEIWPEAYVLGRMSKLVNAFSEQLNEMIPFFCENMIDTVKLTVESDRDDLTEMHIMIFNSMVRKSIETGNLERFQSLSYFYRKLVVELRTKKELMTQALGSFIHYAEISNEKHLPAALETCLYDIGKIITQLSSCNEELAEYFLKSQVAPIWMKYIKTEGHIGKVAWRSLTRTYWECLSLQKIELSSIIRKEYIQDNEGHIQTLEYLLANNRPLHFEYTDRLLRFTYLTREAEKLAREYYHQEMMKSSA